MAGGGGKPWQSLGSSFRWVGVTLILWLCGSSTSSGCPSPLKNPAASQQVELQQNPKAAGATQPDTTTQQLKDLAELKEKGQLTDDEFAAAKARVLNKV